MAVLPGIWLGPDIACHALDICLVGETLWQENAHRRMQIASRPGDLAIACGNSCQSDARTACVRDTGGISAGVAIRDVAFGRLAIRLDCRIWRGRGTEQRLTRPTDAG
jgi:hypothetical protein